MFSYLKFASWETNYNPINVTLDEYILTGEYKKIDKYGGTDYGNWMVCTLSQCDDVYNTTQKHLDIAKKVLSNMLVGFTDKIPEFFERLEVYWNISPSLRKRAIRNGVMKEKLNVQPRKNTTTPISSQAKTVMHAILSHDIELYNYARDTLWNKQKVIINKIDRINRINRHNLRYG